MGGRVNPLVPSKITKWQVPARVKLYHFCSYSCVFRYPSFIFTLNVSHRFVPLRSSCPRPSPFAAPSLSCCRSVLVPFPSHSHSVFVLFSSFSVHSVPRLISLRSVTLSFPPSLPSLPLRLPFRSCSCSSPVPCLASCHSCPSTSLHPWVMCPSVASCQLSKHTNVNQKADLPRHRSHRHRIRSLTSCQLGHTGPTTTSTSITSKCSVSFITYICVAQI